MLALLFGLPLSSAMAQASNMGPEDPLVLSALAGAEPLPAGEMAKESARGTAGGSEIGTHLPVTVPPVHLWDDFGSFSASSISNGIVTINTSGSTP